VLRPELYEPKLLMCSDRELITKGLVFSDDSRWATRIREAKPGDWFAVRFGIAILLGQAVLADIQVYE
jgi:hypothetical protein